MGVGVYGRQEFAEEMKKLVDEHQIVVRNDEADIPKGPRCIWLPPTTPDGRCLSLSLSLSLSLAPSPPPSPLLLTCLLNLVIAQRERGRRGDGKGGTDLM